jgi:hypothetical protein
MQPSRKNANEQQNLTGRYKKQCKESMKRIDTGVMR